VRRRRVVVVRSGLPDTALTWLEEKAVLRVPSVPTLQSPDASREGCLVVRRWMTS
jgi:hypothetical protein